MRAVLVSAVCLVACSRGNSDPFGSGNAPAGVTLSAAAPSEPTLTVTPPADAHAGADAVATILVTPPAGYHLNPDYPMKLELMASTGLAVAKPLLVRGDDGVELDEAHLALAVHVTPSPGAHDLTGKLSLGYCIPDKQCLSRHLPIAVTIAAR
jgi:hypothetical protein